MQIVSLVCVPLLRGGKLAAVLRDVRRPATRVDRTKPVARAGGRAHVVCRRERPRRGGAARESRRAGLAMSTAAWAPGRATSRWTRCGGARVRGAVRLLARRPGLHRERLFERLGPEDRERLPKAIEEALDHAPGLRGRIPVPARADRRVALDGGARPREYDADGKPTMLYGLGIDITDRRRAVEALQEADRRKDEFLATLAHELRNPLAPISSGLHILRSPATPRAATDRARDHGAAGRADGAAGRRSARRRADHDRQGRSCAASRSISPPRSHDAVETSPPLLGSGRAVAHGDAAGAAGVRATATARGWRRCSPTCSTTARSTARPASRSRSRSAAKATRPWCA